VSISWSVPVSNGGSPILDYKIWWDAGLRNDVFVLLQSSTGNLHQFVQSAGIVVNGQYTFKVQAINVVGASNFSQSFTIVAATLPGAPIQLVRYQASIHSIEIRWSQPTVTGGSNITDYRVYWDEGRGTNQFSYIGNTQGYQFFIITNATSQLFIAGKNYTFRVTAVNIIGEGVYT